MPPSKPHVIVLFWHRTDLRLHDSPALQAALDLKPSVFIPVWTWDPHYVYHARVGPNRWKFLIECQQDLSKAYTSINAKQKLWVVREGPQSILPKLWKTWEITHLVFEKDTDAYARQRDEQVIKLAEDAGIEVVVRNGRTLFDPDDIVRKNNGEPTLSMNQVLKASEKINGGVPDRPIGTPETVPDPWDAKKMNLDSLEHDVPKSVPDLNAVYRSLDDGNNQYKQIMGPKKDFAVPTLEELGIDAAQALTPHRGGESVALKMLAEYIKDEEYIGTFEKPKTSPAAFEPQATTLLSPHLHFGSLSVRKFWWDVKSVMDRRHEKKQPTAEAPTNLLGQLLFREMFFSAQAALGHTFSQTFGNKIAHFIPWRLQSTYSKSSDGELIRDSTYAVESEEAENWFRRWRDGRTGFPWIDALMRQLRLEGWIHHLGRHSVACFLTRGGCYVSWERGVDVFQEWLIDRMCRERAFLLRSYLTYHPDEEASNVGNWMWLSCTAFFSQYYRCYSPIAFGKKWDPNGDFVRRYCPELKNYDKKYIYEPWRAPILDQKKWGCRITGDGTSDTENGLKTYPKPIFDFDKQRQVCIESMKQAYNIGLHGNDPKVLDGSWKELFKVQDRSASLMDTTNGPVDDSVIDESPNKRRKLQEHEEENERHMGS